MATQIDLARALGISQATVSRALRGDRSISPETRQAVHAAAARLGYNANNYLSLLMSAVRSGKKTSGRGTVALLIQARSHEDWTRIQAARIFHAGVEQRARELGFSVECFYLKAPGMTPGKLDQILYTRGISGLILPPPYLSNRQLKLSWERYAAVGVGFGWEAQDLDRVVYDDYRNYLTAFRELQRRGYARIGTVLGNQFVCGHRGGNKWFPGYLDAQSTLPAADRIPIFTGSTPMPGGSFTAEIYRKLPGEFRRWLRKWKPSALITLVGNEKKWLDDLNLRIPADLGLVCLAQTAGAAFAGIDEKGDVIGAAALSLVAAKIAHHEYGFPAHPTVTMIEGRWMDGPTVAPQPRPARR
jgi:LacI family transcriptional regulator